MEAKEAERSEDLFVMNGIWIEPNAMEGDIIQLARVLTFGWSQLARNL